MLALHATTRFKKSFKKLPLLVKKDFAKRIEIFRENPFQPSLRTHKLSGNLSEYYAFCLINGFRVLFDFAGRGVVLLVNVGNHDDYKKWGK